MRRHTTATWTSRRSPTQQEISSWPLGGLRQEEYFGAAANPKIRELLMIRTCWVVSQMPELRRRVMTQPQRRGAGASNCRVPLIPQTFEVALWLAHAMRHQTWNAGEAGGQSRRGVKRRERFSNCVVRRHTTASWTSRRSQTQQEVSSWPLRGLRQEEYFGAAANPKIREL